MILSNKILEIEILIEQRSSNANLASAKTFNSPINSASSAFRYTYNYDEFSMNNPKFRTCFEVYLDIQSFTAYLIKRCSVGSGGVDPSTTI
jgi:hypothetical protein